MKSVWHLRASNFVGGPERQILRYCASASPGAPPQILASFTGGGEGEALLNAAQSQGTKTLDLPGGGWRDWHAINLLSNALHQTEAGLLCTHGYRADLLGLL
ncbi:MAG: hypothetical protein ACRD2D_01110, partial [Terriglobales bacterium]